MSLIFLKQSAIRFKHISIVNTVFSLLLLNSISLTYAETASFIGIAKSLKTGDVLYQEMHRRGDNSIHHVEYSEPDGKVFANKTIDFSQSLIVPSFQQINDRVGEETRIKQEGVYIVMEYKKNTRSKVKSKRFKLSEGMVADAGFDGFIKQYWSALVSGKKLNVDYFVPSEQTSFDFQFSQTPCLSGTEKEAVCFSLSPLSWLVKLAVDPIVVAYSGTKKQLLRFTGRANIANQKGKYENVDIQYRYL